jgi:N6-adenosine-specific RNA methylase IME4
MAKVKKTGTKFQLFPALRPDEYDALKADIAERGVLVPVEIDQDGQMLDGHHRLKIAGELGIEAPTVQREFTDDDARMAHVIALNLKRRHLDAVTWGEMFIRYAEARGVRLGTQGRQSEKTDTVSVLASELGVEERTARRHVEAAHLSEPMKEAVRSGAKTVSTAKREAKRTERRESDPGPPPTGTFRTIVIDPPWDYGDHSVRGAAATHYAVMSLADITALPVKDMAGEEAHLYLWVTNPHMPIIWDIIEAWGFDYKTMLTWVKPQMGTGHYFRGATEHVAFCTRGNLPLRKANIRNWFEADRTKHSAKPEKFYKLVEEASHGPYVELFARTRREGWEGWGDEL